MSLLLLFRSPPSVVHASLSVTLDQLVLQPVPVLSHGGGGGGEPEPYRHLPWQMPRSFTRLEFEEWQQREAELRQLRLWLEDEECLVLKLAG